MTKAIAVKQQAATDLVVDNEPKLNMAAQMEEMGISTEDLQIPSIMLMQNTSEYVGDGVAKLCDIVNSQTLEVIGGLDKPVEIVPLKLNKTWRTYDISSGQPKFMRVVPFNSTNSNLPYTALEDGKPIKNVLCFNFYVLLQKEIDAGESFPAVITFKGTYSQAGKNLATQMFKMVTLGRLAYSQTVIVSSKKEKKETNTWAMFECTKGNPTSGIAILEAKKWLATLATTKHTVDQEEPSEDSAPAAKAPSVSAASPDDIY